MTPAFEKWLREHVTDAGRRAALADAADGLVDLYNAERIDFEDVLTISAWPAFARNRFLRAWQALRSEGRAAALAADEGTEELVLRPTDDNEDDADANAETQLDLDVVTDDADSGADEQGLVLAGCDGALFPVARAGPTTRQGLHTIDEATRFSVNQVLRFVRYNKGKAATIRQRAIERHRGEAVDGDVHIDGKHVVALILNYGPDRAAVELLANSVRAVRLGLATVATQTPEVIMAPAQPAPAAAPAAPAAAPPAPPHTAGPNRPNPPITPSVASLKKQLLRGHDRLCTTCKATYTSGHFCPTCETRLVAVDQPTPPLETNRDDETAEEAAAPPPARAKASRFTGVRRDKGHWRASIRVRGSPVHLGEFDDEEDAARTYDAARVKYKGAPTVNFPGEAPLASVLAALPALPSPPPAQPAPAPPPPGAVALSSSNDDGAELTEAEVRGALQAAGGRMKTKDLLVRFKARFKANPANKDAIKRILRAVAVVQDSAGVRVLVLKRPDTLDDRQAHPPPPPPDTSRDEELARQLSGAGERRRKETQRFADLADTGQSYASPKRAAADESRRPKKKAKSSDDTEARRLATDEAAIRKAYAREQAKGGTPGNAALTRRLSTEEIPRGREKKRCAATRAPANPPPARITSPAATAASDKPVVPVTPNIPKVKALASPVRPEYAPTRKQITQQMCGESTASSSSDSDTDEDFSPDRAPVRNGAPVRSPPVESDARSPPNDDTDDDLPLPPPVVKEEPVPTARRRAAIESGGPGEEVAPDDDDETEFFTCSF